MSSKASQDILSSTTATTDTGTLHHSLSVWNSLTIGFAVVSPLVRLMKAVSVKEIRAEYLEVRKQLWGREFWKDGYFTCTVGDKVAAEVTKEYIWFHEAKRTRAEQFGSILESPARFFTSAPCRITGVLAPSLTDPDQ
jgi:hypothetical protein